MNWDQVEGNWKQFKGKVQQQWGALTDDDLDKIEGRQTELNGILQKRYGKTREEADAWAALLGSHPSAAAGTAPSQDPEGTPQFSPIPFPHGSGVPSHAVADGRVRLASGRPRATESPGEAPVRRRWRRT